MTHEDDIVPAAGERWFIYSLKIAPYVCAVGMVVYLMVNA